MSAFFICFFLTKPRSRAETSLQLIDFGKAIDLSVEPEDGDCREIDTAAEGRTGKYHLDYFGIAGCAYCLLFGQYIEVTTARDRWVIKGTLRRWWQVKVNKESKEIYLRNIYNHHSVSDVE